MTKDVYVQLKGILDTVNKAVVRLRKLGPKEYMKAVSLLTGDLYSAVSAVNLQLLDDDSVDFCDMNYLEGRITDCVHKDELIKQYKLWYGTMSDILEEQYHALNSWDEKFIKLMNRVKYVDFDRLVDSAKCSLMKLDDEVRDKLCAYYHGLEDMWGTLDIANERYDVITNRITALKEHREDFIWLYGRLGDWRSRMVLVSILYNWITFELDYIYDMKEANFTDYFDLDLVQCGEEEVVVDLGAWTGDSMQNYINTYSKYKKIYCYEIDKISMEAAKKNLAEYSNIEFRNKGVGSRTGLMYLAGNPMSSGNKVVSVNTGFEIEVVSLDDDITEKVTLIKMDIEGAEQEALLGCRRHIEEEMPKLLISVYHNNEDIWKIPRMAEEMNSEYRFYLRSNGSQWGPAEIVFFAL